MSATRPPFVGLICCIACKWTAVHLLASSDKPLAGDATDLLRFTVIAACFFGVSGGYAVFLLNKFGAIAAVVTAVLQLGSGVLQYYADHALSNDRIDATEAASLCVVAASLDLTCLALLTVWTWLPCHHELHGEFPATRARSRAQNNPSRDQSIAQHGNASSRIDIDDTDENTAHHARRRCKPKSPVPVPREHSNERQRYTRTIGKRVWFPPSPEPSIGTHLQVRRTNSTPMTSSPEIAASAPQRFNSCQFQWVPAARSESPGSADNTSNSGWDHRSRKDSADSTHTNITIAASPSFELQPMTRGSEVMFYY